MLAKALRQLPWETGIEANPILPNSDPVLLDLVEEARDPPSLSTASPKRLAVRLDEEEPSAAFARDGIDEEIAKADLDGWMHVNLGLLEEREQVRPSTAATTTGTTCETPAPTSDGSTNESAPVSSNSGGARPISISSWRRRAFQNSRSNRPPWYLSHRPATDIVDGPPRGRPSSRGCQACQAGETVAQVERPRCRAARSVRTRVLRRRPRHRISKALLLTTCD